MEEELSALWFSVSGICLCIRMIMFSPVSLVSTPSLPRIADSSSLSMDPMSFYCNPSLSILHFLPPAPLCSTACTLYSSQAGLKRGCPNTLKKGPPTLLLRSLHKRASRQPNSGMRKGTEKFETLFAWSKRTTCTNDFM